MGWKLLFCGCKSGGENVFLFSCHINDEMILSDFTFLKVKPRNSKLVGYKCNQDFPSVAWMEEAACVIAIQSWSAWPALLFYWTELLSRISTCFILVRSWRHSIAMYFHCQDKSLHVKLLLWLITAARCNSRHVTHWSVWMCHKVTFPFYYIFSVLGGAVDNLI